MTAFLEPSMWGGHGPWLLIPELLCDSLTHSRSVVMRLCRYDRLLQSEPSILQERLIFSCTP